MFLLNRNSLKNLAARIALCTAFATATQSNSHAETPNLPLLKNDWQQLLSESIVPPNHEPCAISFNTILETGIIFKNARSIKDVQFINWWKDDAFTRTYAKILEEVIDFVETDCELQELLNKPIWTHLDRSQWEEAISKQIGIETDKIPGLDKYRDCNAVGTDGRYARFRPMYLNELSSDIEKHLYLFEFDCESQSAFKGCLLQAVENHFLPKDGNGLKTAMTYHYMTGYFHNNWDAGTIGYHVWISTPLGIVEATTDPSETAQSPYILAKDPDYNLQSFLNGDVFIGMDTRIYAKELTVDKAKQVRLERAYDFCEIAAAQTAQFNQQMQVLDQKDIKNKVILSLTFDATLNLWSEAYTLTKESDASLRAQIVASLQTTINSIPPETRGLQKPNGLYHGLAVQRWQNWMKLEEEDKAQPAEIPNTQTSSLMNPDFIVVP